MEKIDDVTSCEIVQDLLPLYYDGVCSEKSRAYVEKHLKSCSVCRDMMQALTSDAAEEKFEAEAKNILKNHAKKEKDTAMRMGVILAGILMLPVIIVLLMTLPGYSDLKTDAVIIASMLLVAGLTVVPLLSKTKRFSKTIIASTLALLLVIFFTEMFFDDGGWLRFGEIACSTVFGLSLFLAPFVIKQADLPELLENHKGLLAMSWDTLWFYLMMFLFVIDYTEYVKDLLFVSTYCVVFVWLIFVTARYLNMNRWIKAGIIVIKTGIWISVGNQMGWVSVMDRDVRIEALFVSAVLGSGLFLIGAIRSAKHKK